MRPTGRFLQACRITLFTRPNCSLCSTAKDVLSTVWDARPFEYKEVDIMNPKQVGWRNLYEFDTPVVHVSKSGAEELPEKAGKAIKLMHRFTSAELQKKMDFMDGQ